MVEAINDDGTEITTGTPPTIEITGVLELSTRCVKLLTTMDNKLVLNWQAKRRTSPRYSHFVSSCQSEWWPNYRFISRNNRPYPCYDDGSRIVWLSDTYRHVGWSDVNNKKAWLPHGIVGGGQNGMPQTPAMPTFPLDPRDQSNNFPWIAKYERRYSCRWCWITTKLEKALVNQMTFTRLNGRFLELH